MAIIRRDGVTVATVPAYDVLAWFHHSTSSSMSWALEFEGYTVEDEAGA